jgi:hypothetical protein
MHVQNTIRTVSDRRWRHIDLPSTELERRRKGERRQSETTKTAGGSPSDMSPDFAQGM